MALPVQGGAPWESLLRLLREKLPIVREAGGAGPGERVYHAELVGSARERELRLITYRGTVLRFPAPERYELHVLRRDRQGVPVAYRLELHCEDGSRRELELYV